MGVVVSTKQRIRRLLDGDPPRSRRSEAAAVAAINASFGILVVEDTPARAVDDRARRLDEL